MRNSCSVSISAAERVGRDWLEAGASFRVTISVGSNGHALDRGVAIGDAGNVVVATLTDKDRLATTHTAIRVVSFGAKETVQCGRPFTGQLATTGGAVAQSLTD